MLLSDGDSTSGRDPLAVADEARAAGVPVYTVALGTPQGTLPDGKPVPPDTASLRAIAERSGGEAFTAQDADGLSAVYERLGSQVAMKERAARDHRRVRRRRDRAAAGRRRRCRCAGSGG